MPTVVPRPHLRISVFLETPFCWNCSMPEARRGSIRRMMADPVPDDVDAVAHRCPGPNRAGRRVDEAADLGEIRRVLMLIHPYTIRATGCQSLPRGCGSPRDLTPLLGFHHLGVVDPLAGVVAMPKIVTGKLGIQTSSAIWQSNAACGGNITTGLRSVETALRYSSRRADLSTKAFFERACRVRCNAILRRCACTMRRVQLQNLLRLPSRQT